MFSDTTLPTIAGILWILGVIALLIGGIIYYARRGRDEQSARAALSPQVKEISPNKEKEGYRIDLRQPHDHFAVRNRFGRWVVLFLVVGILLLFPTLFGMLWGSFWGGFAINLGGLLGFIGGMYLIYLLSRRLVVYNQEWSAYVTQDPFTGENVPYGPGAHPSYPWEQRNAEGNESLEVITKPFSVPVQTSTAQVEVENSFQYAVDLRGITKFIGNDTSTIEGGYIAFMQSFLTARYATMTAEEARKDIGPTNAALADAFMGTAGDEVEPVDFEDKFGIITVSLVIKSIKLPAAVQKTRDAIDEAAMLHKVVASMIGLTPEELTAKLKSGEITKERHDKLLNRAMATSDNATMDIKVIEGLEGAGGALAAGLFATDKPKR